MEIKALFINKNTLPCTELIKALAPDVTVIEHKFLKTLRMAVQTLSQEDFNVVFIAESFPEDELKPFFQDIRKLAKFNVGIVQTKQNIPEDFNESALRDLGFHSVISYRGTHIDKEKMCALEEVIQEKAKYQERVVDVGAAVTLLLNEVDKRAKNRKRKKEYKVSDIPTDHIDRETTDLESLLGEYFSYLEEETEKRAPDPVKKLDVPDQLVGKLPGAEKDTYTGVSLRVWDRLAKKFGVTESSSGESTAEGSAESDSPDPPQE